jgi:hypothetical protein
LRAAGFTYGETYAWYLARPDGRLALAAGVGRTGQADNGMSTLFGALVIRRLE